MSRTAAAPGGRRAVDTPPSDVPAEPAPVEAASKAPSKAPSEAQPEAASGVPSPAPSAAARGVPSGGPPAVSEAPGQGELFPDPLFDDGFDGVPDRLVGFRGPTACPGGGITHRQLAHLASPGVGCW